MPKIFVLSLGGSLIVPNDVDIKFLKGFKKVIDSFIKKGHKFAIICGGGKLARKLQQSASRIVKLNEKDLDWLGIHATNLNAQLVKSIFKENAENFIVKNPIMRINFNKNVLVAAGWLPGWSTDYDTVLLAKNLGVTEIINMSNVNYLYDKDPKKFKNAKKIEKTNWSTFNKLLNQTWKAGMNVPFDPVAAKEAQKSKIRVNIIGSNLRNFEKLLKGKKFRGTIIE